MVSGAKWGNMASMGVAKCRVDCRGVKVFSLFGLRQSATREGVEGEGRQGGRVALIWIRGEWLGGQWFGGTS